MLDLVIYGAGGLAREIAFLVKEINREAQRPSYSLLGYIDDDSANGANGVDREAIIGRGSWFEKRKEPVACVIGIGNPVAIRNIVNRLGQYEKVSYPNLVHPGTIWDREHMVLGCGNVITAGNIFTTDIRIGSYNILNLGCTYGHDDVIGDCCVINPGCSISGNVTIGDGCLIGTGATILQGLSIGEQATVGAGAVVTKNVEPGTTVVGVPARPQRSRA